MNRRPKRTAALLPTMAGVSYPSRWPNGFRAHADNSSARAALLLVTMSGFVAGYFVFIHDWLQLGWWAVGVTALFAFGWVPVITGIERRFLICSTAFIGWSQLASLFASPGLHLSIEAWRWIAGAALLMVWIFMLGQVSAQRSSIRVMGLSVVFAAAFAAVVSMAWMGFQHRGFPPHLRLANVMVYFGLNPVCTGLTFAFAAMWAACLRRSDLPSRSGRWPLAAQTLLLTAVCFTHSRGALLALIAGHAALIVSRGWRAAAPPTLVLVATLTIFQAAYPALEYCALRFSPIHDSQSDACEASGPAAPIQGWIERSDAGRLLIYEAAVGAQETWTEKVIGLGLWTSMERWTCGLADTPNHLHSVFLAAYVHGGGIGLVLLVMVACRAFVNARITSTRGDDSSFILLCFGVAGLLFDGQTLAVLTTMPRFEPLLFWFPASLASAQARGLPDTVKRPSLDLR